MSNVLDLQLPAQRASCEAARLAVNGFLAPLGIEASTLYSVELVLEETLMNLVWHAVGEDASQTIGLRVQAAPTGIVMEFDDPGPAFDPTVERPVPHLGSLQEAQVGGLGLALVQSMARRMDWRRENDRNHLTVEIARPAVAARA